MIYIAMGSLLVLFSLILAMISSAVSSPCQHPAKRFIICSVNLSEYLVSFDSTLGEDITRLKYARIFCFKVSISIPFASGTSKVIFIVHIFLKFYKPCSALLSYSPAKLVKKSKRSKFYRKFLYLITCTFLVRVRLVVRIVTLMVTMA